MTPNKRVLLFATKLGYQTRSFQAAADRLRVEIAYVTDRCSHLDDPWNDRALPVHFELPEGAAAKILESQGGLPVDGILAVGDRPSVTAAYVARGLGLPHNHPASVEACRSKLRMREVFRGAGVPVPWFQTVKLEPLPEPALLGIHYPCVLKPLSLSASQGVVRANHRDQFVAGAARLKRLLDSPEVRATREPHLDQMLVEGYLEGREVAVEGLLTNGELRVLAIFDKPDPLEGPYFEESIYVTPSQLSEPDQRAIASSFANAVRALGLSHGPVHGEFRLNPQGVWPIEIAARPIGGLCARALRFVVPGEAAPIGLEELLLRHALELPGYDSPRETQASAAMMIPVPHSGILDRVEGEEQSRATPGITSLEITARLHDFIAAWPEGSSYLGFLFARAATSAEAEQALREAHRQLRFTLTPRLPVEHPLSHKLPSAP
ncbi:MAG TPA: ATP-grasp domain-containing protein [Verrucomicrobiae bacterium]|jgi:biotin carboxylase|nr:ATP-grasp domain-containing protein [Verrucomicrobiae bacterium]